MSDHCSLIHGPCITIGSDGVVEPAAGSTVTRNRFARGLRRQRRQHDRGARSRRRAKQACRDRRLALRRNQPQLVGLARGQRPEAAGHKHQRALARAASSLRPWMRRLPILRQHHVLRLGRGQHLDDLVRVIQLHLQSARRFPWAMFNSAVATRCGAPATGCRQKQHRQDPANPVTRVKRRSFVVRISSAIGEIIENLPGCANNLDAQRLAWRKFGCENSVHENPTGQIAGGPRPRRHPRARPGADPRRPRPGPRAENRQTRPLRCRRCAHPPARRRSPLRQPRRPQAGSRSRSLAHRSRAAASASTSAPPPADSPTACCSTAPPASSPSTPATARSPRCCATIPASP